MHESPEGRWDDGATPVTTLDDLVAIIGQPSPAVIDKVQTELTDDDRDFLSRASLCFVATVGPDGLDVSPKGDPGGVALVLDERTIAVPDRPGNRRVDGFRNLLTDPRVGLIFLVPGLGYTLRVNGRARLVSDAPFFDRMVVKGHRPRLAMVIDVDEAFNHCPKAFMRSGAWDPSTWRSEGATRYATLAQRKWRRGDPPEQVEQHYAAEAYEQGLYEQ